MLRVLCHIFKSECDSQHKLCSVIRAVPKCLLYSNQIGVFPCGVVPGLGVFHLHTVTPLSFKLGHSNLLHN